MPKRALRLRRERLSEIDDPDLALVVAGAQTTDCPTLEIRDCVVVPTRESFCTGSCVFPEA